MKLTFSSPAHSKRIEVRVGGTKMKYEIKDINIAQAAYRYLLSAHQDIATQDAITVIYDRVYSIHPLDLRMLVSQFHLELKEIK